jgi:hypothetical protein
MTTTVATTGLPAAWEPLHAALRARRPVWIAYHARRRLVCPHALGWKADKAMLLAYQTGAQTSTGALPADPHKRWRRLRLDQIDQVLLAEHTSTWESADNYNPTRPFPAIDTVAVAIP